MNFANGSIVDITVDIQINTCHFYATKNQSVPHLPPSGRKMRPASYNSNVMALDRTKIRGVHEIRHFSCEGDFYTFQNHMYKTV